MKTYPNLQDTVKAVSSGKFIVVNAYINRSQINNLPLNLKEPEKEKQIKGKKEIRYSTNKHGKWGTTENWQNQKSVLWKYKKIDKTLVRLKKIQDENKSEMKAEMKRIIREHYELLCANKVIWMKLTNS